MAPQRLISGAAIETFQRLDSTSAEAKRRSAAGERGPLWIIAVEQSSGYGRRGTAWVQAPGDFAGTFLFDAATPSEKLGELSFVAGLGAYEAIAGFVPHAPLSLKWPNDVLAAGAKIAGLLLELVAPPAIVSLGVGVNIVSRPDSLDYPAARLVDFLKDRGAPSPEEFLASLDVAFARWRQIWRREGFAPIRASWLERAARLGDPIRVRLPDGEVWGVFRDLDPTGALVLDCNGERRLIAAGAILSGRGE